MTAKRQTCQWWADIRTQDLNLGQCRIRAPGPAPYERKIKDITYTGPWPFVGASDWCGEHQLARSKTTEQ